LRQRQAFLVRKLKEKTDPALWERLRNESPRLLKDVPTDGRDIDWDTLDTAEMPLFGSNKGTVGGADVAAALLAGGDFAMDVAAARRLERHFAEELARIEREERRERTRRCRAATFNLVLLAIVGGLVLLFHKIPHPDPLQFVDPPSQRLPYIDTIPNITNIMAAANCTMDSAWRSHHADITWPNGTKCMAHGACICAPPSPPPNAASFCWDILHHGCPNTECKLIFWIPIVCVAIGNALGVVLAVVQAVADDEHRGAFVLFVVLGELCLTALCLWPVLVGPFGHWSYTLVVGPICSGAMSSVYAVFVLAVLLGIDIDDDDVAFTWGTGFCLMGYLTNLYCSIAVRVPITIDGDVPADGCIHSGTALAQSVVEIYDASALSVYTCTPVCEAFRVATIAACAAGCLCVLGMSMKNRDEAECSWLLRVPLCLAFVFGATSWPLLLSASTLASSGPWLYICIVPCISLPWIGSLYGIYCALENTLLGRCAWLDMILREAYVGHALVMAGPIAAWMLLYIFRSSPDDNTFIAPPLWAEIYLWEGAVVMGLFLLATPLMFEDEDDFVIDVFFPLFVVWGSFMFLTALQMTWMTLGWFVFLSFVWLLPPAAISAFIGMLVEEGECNCCGAFGKVFAAFMAFVVSAGPLATMILIYATDDFVAPGDTSNLPTAFAVTGAFEPALDGLYIVRNDLATTVCTDEDKEYIRVQEFCDVCSSNVFLRRYVPGLQSTSQFYHMVPGCDTQHCVMGHTDGFVLYQVLGSTMWVLAKAEHAIGSCGSDPTSLAHSLMIACYTSPSGAACASKWREVVNDVNGTSAWVDAKRLSITDSNAPSAAKLACQPSVMLVSLFLLCCGM
jgi:hypothetical protein